MEVRYHAADFSWESLQDELRDSIGCVELDRHQEGGSGPPCKNRKETDGIQSGAWEEFHQVHSSGKFFKERRYLLAEFPELSGNRPLHLLEVGCGNGSTVVPLLRGNQEARVSACDCSDSAVALTVAAVGENLGEGGLARLNVFKWDPSTQEPPSWLVYSNKNQDMVTKGQIQLSAVDAVTMVFVLSAVHPADMPSFIRRVFSVLSPGGYVFFRDYGLYDMTMLRFDKGQKVSDRLYRRGDGTLSYFFSKEVLKDLFMAAGFLNEELEYCCVKLVNRRKKQLMRRVWLHAKFRKPVGEC